jgi:hypothetical protein
MATLPQIRQRIADERRRRGLPPLHPVAEMAQALGMYGPLPTRPSHIELTDDEAIRLLVELRRADSASAMHERLKKAGVVLARRNA